MSPVEDRDFDLSPLQRGLGEVTAAIAHARNTAEGERGRELDLRRFVMAAFLGLTAYVVLIAAAVSVLVYVLLPP